MKAASGKAAAKQAGRARAPEDKAAKDAGRSRAGRQRKSEVKAASGKAAAKQAGRARAPGVKKGAEVQAKPAGRARTAPKGSAGRAVSPGPAPKKGGSAAESARLLASEVRAVSGALAENQEALASMKAAVDGLAGAAESLRSSERRARAIEGNTKKIYEGLEELRARAGSIAGPAGGTGAAGSSEGEPAGIEEMSKNISEVAGLARGNSTTIAKIGERIDGALREASAKADAVLAAGRQIEEIGADLRSLDEKVKIVSGGSGGTMPEDMAGVKEAIESMRADMAGVKEAIGRLSGRTGAEGEAAGGGPGSPADTTESGSIPDASAVATEVAAMREQVEGRKGAGAPLSAGAGGLDASAVATEVAAMREQVERAASRADAAASAAGEATAEIKARAATADARPGADPALAARIGSIESKLDALAKIAELAEQADAQAPAAEPAGAAEADIARLGDDMASRTDSIERRIDSLADALSRSEASASEFRASAGAALGRLRGPREAEGGAPGGPSADATAILRLSEYRSGIGMRAESKYGGADDLDAMASRTADIAGILGRAPGNDAGIRPAEVRRWAVSRILECADRWDVRFSDALALLVARLGRDAVGEAVRERQVRDVYGARAVAELRAELGMDVENRRP